MTPNFRLYEFQCNCGCPNNRVNPTLLHNLQLVRDELKEPIKIASGYRCPEYNKKVGGSPESSHIHGLAADIVIPNSAYAYRFMEALFKVNVFDRIGYGEANGDIIFHVDKDNSKIPKLLWGY